MRFDGSFYNDCGSPSPIKQERGEGTVTRNDVGVAGPTCRTDVAGRSDVDVAGRNDVEEQRNAEPQSGAAAQSRTKDKERCGLT